MLAGAFPSLPLTLIDTDTLMHCKHAHTALVFVCVCENESGFDRDTKREKAGESDGGADRVSRFLSSVHVSRRV